MKIFIDSSWHVIYEWENGKIGQRLTSFDHRYPAAFQRIVDKILTPSQQVSYCTGNDIVYLLSKKKEKVLRDIIDNQKQTHK